MEKLVVTLTLVAALLAGCSTTTSTTTTTKSAESAETTIAATTEAPTTTETATSAAASQIREGDVGEYHVKITGYKLSKDYEDNPTIIVEFDYTNNSADTTSAMVATSITLYQDGIELEMGMSAGDDDYDSSNLIKDIKTGATLDCQSMYVLRNTGSPVEVEITSLSDVFSISPAMVTDTVDLSAIK